MVNAPRGSSHADSTTDRSMAKAKYVSTVNVIGQGIVMYCIELTVVYYKRKVTEVLL